MPVLVFLLLAGITSVVGWLVSAPLSSRDLPPPAADAPATRVEEPAVDGGERARPTDGGVDATQAQRLLPGEMNAAGRPDAGGEGRDPPPEDREVDIGWLRFSTHPPTDVFVRDEYIGKTPVQDMELPPGRYLLRLRNSEAGIDETFRVRIRKGEVTSHEVFY